jgi:hypothetical protein
VAWTLPYTELLKCERPDGSYRGTLICASTDEDFTTIRDAMLATANDKPQEVTDLPAGRDQAWTYQVSFPHENGGAGRVLWHDSGSQCLAEMQLDDTDLSVALGHFTAGSG